MSIHTAKADSPEAIKKDTALSFINPEKFIVQNNFIPVPSILMNPKGSRKLHHGGGVQAQKFINSGENLT